MIEPGTMAGGSPRRKSAICSTPSSRWNWQGSTNCTRGLPAGRRSSRGPRRGDLVSVFECLGRLRRLGLRHARRVVQPLRPTAGAPAGKARSRDRLAGGTAGVGWCLVPTRAPARPYRSIPLHALSKGYATSRAPCRRNRRRCRSHLGPRGILKPTSDAAHQVAAAPCAKAR